MPLNRLVFLLALLAARSELLYASEKLPVTITRTAQAPRIDGLLNEDCWNQGVPYDRFFQSAPVVGTPDQQTRVVLLYDNDAIYVGATCFISNDSIWLQLTQRDNIGETDAFWFGFDTYRDGQNAFAFGVSTRNVQADVKFSQNSEEDIAWDAVWESGVSLHDGYWTAEFKIPYSALRFPVVDVQEWNVDLYRPLRRSRREYHSCGFDPEVNGFVSQWQPLTGLRDVKSPLRLSVTPYGTVYYNLYSDPENDITIDDVSIKGGMDLKWGISESFTLDATLIPDFGQVQSDNIIYNLSAIEVEYDENRSFFTEGIELFEKAELFYTRRIGFVSDYYDDHPDTSLILVSEPLTSNLYNATKFSGRTKNGLGIGVFNAVTGNTYAGAEKAEGEPVEVLVDPLSNYNVLVFDQSLKNNSYITFTNTNVIRDAGGRDANVSCLMTYLANKKLTYAGSAYASVSTLFNQSPESGNTEVTPGYHYSLAFSKISGNLTFEASHEAISEKYNINDMGFLPFYDQNDENFYLNYSIYEPFGQFNEFHTEHNVTYRYRNSDGAYVGFFAEGSAFLLTRKYFGFYGWYFVDPFGYHNYYEPRAEDRYYAEPTLGGGGAGFSTDYRKHLALDAELRFVDWAQEGRTEYGAEIEPRLRIGDRFLMTASFNINTLNNNEGWVETVSDEEIYFGRRDIFESDNIIGANYYFSNNLWAGLKIRYYTNSGAYDSYYLLQEDGTLSPAPYSGNANYNFNAWNIDLNLTWWFLPGSEINLVWKNAITGFDDNTDLSFMENFRGTFDNPVNNSLSLRIRYYLDYQMMKKIFHG